eukprot:sb/3464871/
MIPQIVIDTDCGVDDTFCTANFAALHRAGKCKIRGVTTVCGNIPTEAAFQNTSRLLREFIGLDVLSSMIDTVHCFMVRFKRLDLRFLEIQDLPLANTLIKIDNCLFSGVLSALSTKVYDAKCTQPTSESFLANILSKSDPNTITIVAIGPLTNLAKVEETNPGLLARAKQIVIMGGAIYEEGNCPKTNMASEYNFGMDGAAADVILGLSNVVLFPLDLTIKIRFDMDYILETSERLAEEQSNFIKNIVNGAFESMVEYNETTRDDRRLNIHDVHCFVYVLNPELYQTSSNNNDEEFSALRRSVLAARSNGNRPPPPPPKSVKDAEDSEGTAVGEEPELLVERSIFLNTNTRPPPPPKSVKDAEDAAKEETEVEALETRRWRRKWKKKQVPALIPAPAGYTVNASSEARNHEAVRGIDGNSKSCFKTKRKQKV